MSLYGMMRTGVSGMNAQANRLSAVADNIANSSTVGYKRAEAQFASLVLPSTAGQYNSGSVTTEIRNSISSQGGIRSTASGTDLAISGNGYFIVSNATGTPYLTRAGSFVQDKDGYLVNTAGYYLLGYPVDQNGNIPTVANGFDGLSRLNLRQFDLVASPSTSGTFTVNLPAADKVKPDGFNHKTSLIAYDNLGGKIKLDVAFTKKADNSWQVDISNSADGALLTSGAMNFDPLTGKLTSDGKFTVNLANYNGKPIELNLGASKQLAADYSIHEAVLNGQAPSSIKGVDIAADGSVHALYENGVQKVISRMPLGTTASPDKMTVVNGNVFSPSAESGSIRVGYPNSGGMGKISAGALEESNADIAQELTDMIESQRSYTANSKVFQTGSELMDVLVNLKR